MAEDNLNPEPHEIDQAIADTQVELDNPETPEVPETPEETPEVEEKVIDETPETPEETPSDEEPDNEPVETPEETPDEVDYKEKFSNSSREAALLAAKLKKQNEALEQAGLVKKPTEEEMRDEYPEWDEMSATEKKLATNSVWSDRRFGLIENLSKETKDIEAWNGKVDTFVEDPKSFIKYPRLEGKVEGFKAFCVKETRRGVDFEDLVGAFLNKIDSERKPKKGQMFEKPSGGSNEPIKPVSDKLSVEESAKLMETDYSKWQEMLMAGKLADQ